MKELVQRHAFASSNRRTAFITAVDFVRSNNGKFRIADNPLNAKVMLGIRENCYSDEEIMEWIRNGKIREFER